MDFLTVADISKQKEGNHILKEVSFSLERLQKIAIAGETGSGKSTLLKIIAGLLQRDGGEVIFEGEKVLGPDEKLLPGHPHIAYLSQHFELRNNYRVNEILEMANKMPDSEAAAIFEVCRITHLLGRRTDQLSGGEKQRIATARLLITLPKLLVLDEPYSNLDVVHRNILKHVIRDISDRLRITCILTSHDPSDTLSWADEIIVMKDGQIVQKGTPEQVYKQPKNEYVAGLFGIYNLLASAGAYEFPLFATHIFNGKRALVRPEDFVVSKEDTPGVRGTVQKVFYFGSYLELEVALRESTITAKVPDINLQPGDTVYLNLKNDIWYL